MDILEFSKYVSLLTLDGLKPLNLYDKQILFSLASTTGNYDVVSRITRQTGYTSLNTFVALYKALHTDNQIIGVFDTSNSSSIELLARATIMHESIPKELNIPSIVRSTKNRLEFNNGSVIQIVGHNLRKFVGIRFNCILYTSYKETHIDDLEYLLDNKNITTYQLLLGLHYNKEDKKTHTVVKKCIDNGSILIDFDWKLSHRDPNFKQSYISYLGYDNWVKEFTLVPMYEPINDEQS